MEAVGTPTVPGESAEALRAEPQQLDTLTDMAWSVLGVIVVCGAVSRETLLRLYGFRQTSCTALDTALQVLKGVPPDRRKKGKGTWVDIRPSNCLALGCQRAGKITRVQAVQRPGSPTQVNLMHAPSVEGAVVRRCRRDYAGPHVETFRAWLDARRLEPAPPQYARATALDGRHAVYAATPHGLAQLAARAAIDEIALRAAAPPPADPPWALHAQALLGEAVALAIEAAGCQNEPWRLPLRQGPGGAPVAWQRDPGEIGAAARTDPEQVACPFSVMVLPGRVLWLLPVHAALGRPWWDARSLASLAGTVARFERYAMDPGSGRLATYLAEVTGRDDAVLRLVLLAPSADREAALRALDACPSLYDNQSRLVTLVYTPRELADYLVDRLKLARVPPRVPRQLPEPSGAPSEEPRE